MAKANVQNIQYTLKYFHRAWWHTPAVLVLRRLRHRVVSLRLAWATSGTTILKITLMASMSKAMKVTCYCSQCSGRPVAATIPSSSTCLTASYISPCNFWFVTRIILIKGTLTVWMNRSIKSPAYKRATDLRRRIKVPLATNLSGRQGYNWGHSASFGH